MSVLALSSFARRLLRDTRGAAITEYIIIVGLVAVICIAAYRTFGSTINTKVRQQTTRIIGI